MAVNEDLIYFPFGLDTSSAVPFYFQPDQDMGETVQATADFMMIYKALGNVVFRISVLQVGAGDLNCHLRVNGVIIDTRTILNAESGSEPIDFDLTASGVVEGDYVSFALDRSTNIGLNYICRGAIFWIWDRS